MHLKRWLTALIGLPVLVYIIGPGPAWLFYSFLCLLSLAGLFEFYRITVSDLPVTVCFSIYIFVFLLFFSIYEQRILLSFAIIISWAFVPLTYFMLASPSPGNQLTSCIGKAVLGPVYVALPLAVLALIYRRPYGKLWIFFLLTIIFANDTGAFYAGKLFGKHKLYEAISPKKTWEGTIGGLITGLILSCLFVKIMHLHQFDMSIIFLVLLISIAGQIGDLVESMLKRNHGVKDSGNILPGHGGILDRIDSLIFAAPILFVYLSLCI